MYCRFRVARLGALWVGLLPTLALCSTWCAASGVAILRTDDGCAILAVVVSERRFRVDQARRVALAAQGFGRREQPLATDHTMSHSVVPAPTPSRVDRRHLRAVMGQMGVIQIDSVNVLVRSQELPLFARLGPHRRDLIDRATAAGDLIEYWVHEASHIPATDHPLWRWRMASPHRWSGPRSVAERAPQLVENVYRRVRDDGPVTVGDLRTRPRRGGSWWDWDDTKAALEHLFWCGRLTARRRPRDFARVYDITERALPDAVVNAPTPSRADAHRELVRRAVGHLGVGTLDDIADYHRLRTVEVRDAIADLVSSGEITPVQVENWDRIAYCSSGVTVPRKKRARALLSPFDPVVWHRPRAERLFDFSYRLEIYTPAPRRRFGYYVLPFLLDGELVGRVDLKADRANRRLLVRAAWIEAMHDVAPRRDEIAAELLAELESMAQWLELDEGVDVAEAVGDLADRLRVRVAARAPKPT